MKKATAYLLVFFLILNACNDAEFEERGATFGSSNASYSNGGVKLTSDIINTSGKISEKGFIVTRTLGFEEWYEEDKTYTNTYSIEPDAPFELLLTTDFDAGKKCTYTPYVVINNYKYIDKTKEFTAPSGVAPIIEKVTPESGTLSDEFVITGKNFSIIPNRTKVYLGSEYNQECEIIHITETEIRVRVDYLYEIDINVPINIYIKVGSQNPLVFKDLYTVIGPQIISMTPKTPIRDDLIILELDDDNFSVSTVTIYDNDKYITELNNWNDLRQEGNRISFTLPSWNIDWDEAKKYSLIVKMNSEKNGSQVKLKPYMFSINTPWQLINSAPGGQRSYITPVVYNDYAFVLSERNINRYDSKNNTWQSFSIPDEINYDNYNSPSPIMFAVNDYLYMCNTWFYHNAGDTNPYGKRIYRMNIYSGEWTMQKDTEHILVSVTPTIIGNDAYILVGEGATSLNSLYKYNSVSQEWKLLKYNVGEIHHLLSYNNELWCVSYSNLYKMDMTSYQLTLKYSADMGFTDLMICDGYIYYLHNQTYKKLNLETGITYNLGSPRDMDYYNNGYCFFIINDKVYSGKEGKLYQYTKEIN